MKTKEEINLLAQDFIELKDHTDELQIEEYLQKVDALTDLIFGLFPKKIAVSDQLPPPNSTIWLWSKDYNGCKLAQLEDLYKKPFFNVVNGFGIIGMDGIVRIDRATYWMLIPVPDKEY